MRNSNNLLLYEAYMYKRANSILQFLVRQILVVALFALIIGMLGYLGIFTMVGPS